MAPVDKGLRVVSPVDGEHDAGQQGEVGDAQDESDGQLGVVGLRPAVVLAGGAPVSGLAAAGGEDGQAGRDDLPTLSAGPAVPGTLAGRDGDDGRDGLGGAEAEPALARHAAVREE